MTQATESPVRELHPAATDTSRFVRTLSEMTTAHPSVLYAQAVLRPSLALAQGHSLALIQGVKCNVLEWSISPDLENFDQGIRKMIQDVEKHCHDNGKVLSVEMGETMQRGKPTVETLRLCGRDDRAVQFVVLYAGKTILMHRLRECQNDVIDPIEQLAFETINAFATSFEPVQKGYINHIGINDGKITSSRNEINDNGAIIDIFYPQITEGATAFVDRYLGSESSLLNLYGVGGTGKSTLMRKIAARSQGRHVLLVDNPAIYRDAVLASNLMGHIRGLCAEGERVLALFEEVDNYIESKSIENDFLVQLLSMSSGVVKLDVKIVLASNLANADKVLNVLQRSGRSFGSVEFTNFDIPHAQACRAALNLPERDFGGRSSVTLAEAICEEVTRVGANKNRTGF